MIDGKLMGIYQVRLAPVPKVDALAARVLPEFLTYYKERFGLEDSNRIDGQVFTGLERSRDAALESLEINFKYWFKAIYKAEPWFLNSEIETGLFHRLRLGGEQVF